MEKFLKGLEINLYIYIYMLNNIHFRNSFLSELKHLKTTIKHLNKQLEMLRRPKGPITEDIITLSSSPIRSAEYQKEIQEIRQLWDDSSNSWDDMI